ncbi:MAG: acylphosphatase [Candidatus Micrarchaeia archaeon]
MYIIVHGIVQGVGYRAFVKAQADRSSIKGYVKNMDDGSVEIFAIGPEGKLAEFASSLHLNEEHGPDVFYIEKHKEGESGFVDKGDSSSFSIMK